MRLRLVVFALSLLPAMAAAQTAPSAIIPPFGGGGSAAATITGGTTATSGCIAGGVLRSISNLVDCSAGLTYTAGLLSIGTASVLDGSIRLFNADHGFYTELLVSQTQSANASYTFPVNDGPASSRLDNDGAGVLSWKFDQTKYVTADQSDTTGSFVNVTDLGFTVEANTVYAFDCAFLTISAVSTTAVHIAFNGPASPTNFNYAAIAANLVNSFVSPAGNTYDSTAGLTTTAAATQATVQRFNGLLENGANAGTFTARLRTEVAASAATIQRGSWCRVWTP